MISRARKRYFNAILFQAVLFAANRSSISKYNLYIVRLLQRFYAVLTKNKNYFILEKKRRKTRCQVQNRQISGVTTFFLTKNPGGFGIMPIYGCSAIFFERDAQLCARQNPVRGSEGICQIELDWIIFC